jgi:sulfatase maturation enzyme AslB (radical SAM superfamily)
MLARVRSRVRLKKTGFGGICYVPSRDSFFALDANVYGAIIHLGDGWKQCAFGSAQTYRILGEFGICETQDPATVERPYHGPGLLGDFKGIPTLEEPLLVNCMCTLHCHLECIYCIAHQMIRDTMAQENRETLDKVILRAKMVPSIVAVITGGDPLAKPRRAARMIDELSDTKSLVLDTSGVGDLKSLLPSLIRHNVHIRVSLDSVFPVNDKLRPMNRCFDTSKRSSGTEAVNTIRRCVENGLSVTVRTVVTSLNESVSQWQYLRDYLVRMEVQNWILQLVTKAGRARQVEEHATAIHRKGIVPGPDIRNSLRQFVADIRECGWPINIRCVDNENKKTSVLILGVSGDFWAGRTIQLENISRGDEILSSDLWQHVDRRGHLERYLNWNDWLHHPKKMWEMSVTIPVARIDGGETQRAVQ